MKGLNTVNFTQSEVEQLTVLADSKNVSVDQLIQKIVQGRLHEICGSPLKSGDVVEFKSPRKTNLPDIK
jgi:hypothetical protein